MTKTPYQDPPKNKPSDPQNDKKRIFITWLPRVPHGTKWEKAKFVATRPFANLLNKVYANIALYSVAPLSHSHKCS